MKIFDFFNIKKFLIIKKIKKDYNSILLERVLVKVLRAKRVIAWLENQGLKLFFHANAQIVSFKDAEIIN